MSDLNDRKLDAEIATRVMGWHESIDYDYHPPQINWVNASGEFERVRDDSRNPETVNHLSAWMPSRDISAAMGILELADGAWILERYRETDHKLYFKCEIRFGDSIGTQWGCSSPAEAICRAALRAKAGQALTQGKNEA